MKRRNHIKAKQLMILLFSITLFNSCLKDKGPVQDFSQSPPVISFQTDGQGATSLNFSVLGTTTAQDPSVDSVEVSLGVSSLTIGSTVTVNVATDQATLDDYNAANGTSYLLLPAADYSLQNNGTWTIPAGKNLVRYALSVNGSNIDFTQTYAIPLKITSSNGGGAVVATNLNTVVIIINPANAYTGNYTAGGTRILYNGSTVGSGVAANAAIGGTIPFIYISDSVSECQAADLAGTYMFLTIHPDNTVTIGPTTNGDPTFDNLQNDPSNPVSTYDPSAKTFNLHFIYYNASGNLRVISETLVLQQ